MSNHGFQNEQAREFPPIVIMDITNVCNIECIHCPQVIIKAAPDYHRLHLDWEIHKKVVDEIAENEVLLLRYTGDGEPMLHPRFLEMIAYVKEKGIKPVNLTTNGTCLNRRAAERLLATGIDVIDISIDAFTKARYEEIRRKSNFDRVMANVHGLIEARNALSAQTKIMVSMVDQPEARDEVEQFVKHWTPLADNVLVRTYFNIQGLLTKDDGLPNELVERYPCPQLWKRVTISYTGHLKFCVNDWCNRTFMAYLGDQGVTIKGVWKSLAYDQLRDWHLKGQYHQILICDKCWDWVASPWDHGYEKAIDKVLSDSSSL